MNATLFLQTWRFQRIKLLAVLGGLAIWGFLMPVIYSQFGVQFKKLFDSGVIPRQFAEFGEGDVFSLPGAISLGFIHPISLLLNGIFAVGFASAAIAGERQRGTLEVLLARPISRRGVHATLYIALLVFLGMSVAAILAGNIAGAALFGVLDQLDLSRVPVLWLNGVLLFGAIGSIGLAASVSFDRLTPALGVTLTVVLVSYFLEILGSLWPDARGLQPYSLFFYLKPRAILIGQTDLFSFGLLLTITLAAIGYALAIFPRRDLAAPS
jgi:ABC-type transport system involved in multi-copper enzyme maturation permease subunit